MIKLIANFEHKINEWTCQFLMNHNTPIDVAEEMALAFIRYLGQVKDAAKAQAEAAKQEESPKIEAIQQPQEEVINVE